ncbi:hypothetical protein [Bosea beijingensis]|uniref:hypothetical protein n=1 Tax=Bosea beijingensis TaxID=3068632 RepID=UPI002741249F|nr:hypothetical protein [Bosea sp. REN20]
MAKADRKRENPALLEDERKPANTGQTAIEADPTESRRVSDRTNVHDAGSDANDTPDGLTESEEAVRQAAEDVPVGRPLRGRTESIPVFDRGSLPPKT